MIRVTDRYGIEIETSEDGVTNYIVKDCTKIHSTAKDGRKIYKSIAYYSYLRGALRKVCELEQARKLSERDMDLKEALQICRDMLAQLEKLLEQHCGM